VRPVSVNKNLWVTSWEAGSIARLEKVAPTATPVTLEAAGFGRGSLFNRESAARDMR